MTNFQYVLINSICYSVCVGGCIYWMLCYIAQQYFIHKSNQQDGQEKEQVLNQKVNKAVNDDNKLGNSIAKYNKKVMGSDD